MEVLMPSSPIGTESPMNLDKKLSYEKRLAELESQIQALLNWKKAILATLTLAIRPTAPAATRRKSTADVVWVKRKGSIHLSVQTVAEDVLQEKTAPAAIFDCTIVAEPEEVKPLPRLLTVPTPLASPAPCIVAHKILDVLQSYGRHTESDGGDKHKWLGRDKFFPRVERFVRAQQPVKMILPSFPWKSVNRIDKVTGALPDLGEELALARLDALCVDIGKVYEHGAEVHIATDGLAFNDVVGISDEDTWEYSVALLDMAAKKGFKGIKMLRVMDILGHTTTTTPGSPPLTKAQYLSLVSRGRSELESQLGGSSSDRAQEVRRLIETDRDTLLTYRGFIRFLETDLRHSPVAAGARSGQHYRRIVKEAAMRMMARAEAFTKVIQARCPDYVRLSIHPSSGAAKLSVPLLVEKSQSEGGGGGGFPRTPWHSCVAVALDGGYRAVHARDVRDTHDLVCKGDGRPWCFRERSDLFDLGEGVEIEHLYPCGLEIRPRHGAESDAARAGEGDMEGDAQARLSPAAEDKLIKLATLQPVRLVGFANALQLPNLK
ncbi:hypothetical protein N658DRAFT_511763 [Parathielavia hyrcaniae]|uniref:Pyoverdine/dityrosine biosynthesis protein n=1 Tax=Parathielavia hyrcaniae TaxID=113614 RepID=A0AAN6PPY1_9PEZI|nr:hypothetical protein N658DRAFT_511763 [Parathielavia hyrcaniae]